MGRIIGLHYALRGPVLCCWLCLAALPAAAAEYRIDPSHAFIEFRISHLGYSVLSGRFNTFSGNFTWDREDPLASSVTVTVQTASIDSNWAERDEHLRSPDFLDVERYPTAVFGSIAWRGDASGGTLEGELTLHGVTRPVVLHVRSIGEGPDPWGNYRAGFSATTTLRRADFGMDYNLGPSAETMELHLFVEGIRQ